MPRGSEATGGAAGGRLDSPVLVGRERELARLLAAVSAPPAVVTVEGESGIGKTRLVSELRERPELAGRRFLTGWCRQIREPFPLGPVLDAVRGLAGDLPPDALSPVAGALRPLLPELSDRLPPRPEPLEDRADERHRVFRALVEVLASVGPTVLVIEDLHWADAQTTDFLGYLLADPPASLGTVLTYRAEEVDPVVPAMTARLPAPVRRAHLRLAPLDEAATAALTQAALGIDRISAPFASHLCRQGSGVPLAILELLALLQERGTLVEWDGRWLRRALDELDVPAGIKDPVRERVARLTGGARSVVEAAAVLQVPVPERMLLATAGTDPAESTPALAEALRSGLLAEQADATIGFRHVLAAQATYEELPGVQRRELHARAAAAVQEVEPVPLGQVAHHLRHAARWQEWAVAAEAAADQAVALGHDTEAARLLEEVLRHGRPEPPEQRGRIAVKLAWAAVERVYDRDLTDLLVQVLEQDLPRAERGELRFLVGALLQHNGREPARWRPLLVQALPDLHDRPALRAHAMIGLAIVGDGGPRAESSWLDRALAVVAELADPTEQVYLLGKSAGLLVRAGDPRWRQVAGQIVRRTGGRPARWREIDAFYSVGLHAAVAGHHESAAQLLDRARRGAEHSDSRRMRLYVESATALLDYARGSWSGLPERVVRLSDELAEHPTSWIDVEVVRACLALALGDPGSAWQRLTETVGHAERLRDVDCLPMPVAATARLAVARGEAGSVLPLVRRYQALLAENGGWAPATRALALLTEALLTAGEPGEARMLVAWFATQLRGLEAPLAPAALRHARGLLAATNTRWPAAARHFLAAAERYESLGCPYEVGQCREQAAAALFAAGAPGAEPTLRAALGSYRRLGARWDLERVFQLARRHGLSLPARHRDGPRGYGDGLSPREREVAELVSTGRTNREIAAELFLSMNTVNHHVSAALRKLGLPSRAALTHHLATTRAAE